MRPGTLGGQSAVATPVARRRRIIAEVPCVPITTEYEFIGAAQTYTVPLGVTQLVVDLYGAQGGNNGGSNASGAGGGRVSCILTVTPGEVLQVNVGGKPDVTNPATSTGGWNGGGNGATNGSNSGGGGGGGATDIRRSPYGLANRLVVAGGGGGAGGNGVVNNQAHGFGAYPEGGDGVDGTGHPIAWAVGGGGGTQSAGGAGGAGAPGSGTAGGLATGGNGGGTVIGGLLRGGGGGGGGYYGGGGGGGATSGQQAAAGGGGSGFVTGTFVVAEDGVRLDHGRVMVRTVC